MITLPAGLTVRNLSKHYGDFTALDNINFEIPEGQFVTLLGPSGCGKTTLLRIIAGFLECDSGEVYFGELADERRTAQQAGYRHVLPILRPVPQQDGV